jgi:hypothetical protein
MSIISALRITKHPASSTQAASSWPFEVALIVRSHVPQRYKLVIAIENIKMADR